MRPKYQPYKPTKWEQRIDAALRIIAPKWQFNRMVAREREHFFSYLAAYPSVSRRNANAGTSGETMKGAREKLAVMWNAIQCVENNGLCTGILTKFATYVCGNLRWQARTGDRMVNQEYEDYMRIKLGSGIDLTGRFSFRQQCILDVRSILIKGDVGCNIVRQGSELYLQGIEADRIGDPYDYRISDNYVRGLVLDDVGIIKAVRLYRRDRAKALYVFDNEFPVRDEMGMPKFLFLVNPITYDDYRGVSVFKTAIDNSTYIDRMREYELQALMWAASQSGVYHTSSGLLPEQLPFDSPSGTDASGNDITTYQVRPNTVTALGVGENVSMFQHDRPSPNVIGMVRDTIRDIAVGTGLSFEFVWDQSQLGGPAVRSVSGADARAIEMWQSLFLEQKLDPITTLLLGNAIANKELPYHPQWQRWQWFFPPKGTIDVGRESQANIQEIAANINTGARVAAEDGQDINEIQFQRGVETEQIITVAMEVAKRLSTNGEQIDWREVYGIMSPAQKKGAGGQPGGGPFGGIGGGPAVREANPDGQGATDDGVDIEDKETSRFRHNGHSKEREQVLRIEHVWYSPSQARDESGRFADEGGTNTRPQTPANIAALQKEYYQTQVEQGTGIPEGAVDEGLNTEYPDVAEKIGRYVMDNDVSGITDAISDPRYEEYQADLHRLLKRGYGDKPFMVKRVEGYAGGTGEGAGDYVSVSTNPFWGAHAGKMKTYYVNAKDVMLAGSEEEGELVVRRDGLMRKLPETHEFYRPDQARDESGRFADEGGGDVKKNEGGGELPQKATDVSEEQFVALANEFQAARKEANKIRSWPAYEQRLRDEIGEEGVRERLQRFYDLRNTFERIGGFKATRIHEGAMGRLDSQQITERTVDGDWARRVHRKARSEAVEFYRPDQARDDSGRFADEGGGESGKGGAAAAAVEAPAKAEAVSPHPHEHAVRADHPDWSDEDVAKSLAAPPKSNVTPPATQTVVTPPSGPDDLERYSTEIKATPEYKAARYESTHLAPEGATPDEIEAITLKQHSDDQGRLSKEREVLHEQIVNKFLNPEAKAAEGKRPVFLMMLGKPGSGKTTAGGPIADKLGVQFTSINPDDIRQHLPEYTGSNAPATQEESKQISDRLLLNRALRAKHNILFDQTGSNGDKMERYVNEMSKAGYDVQIVHVHKPLHESVQTAFERFRRSGRFVDADYINTAVDHKPEKTYARLKNNPNVKRWTSIDNTGNKAQFEEEGSR